MKIRCALGKISIDHSLSLNMSYGAIEVKLTPDVGNLWFLSVNCDLRSFLFFNWM